MCNKLNDGSLCSSHALGVLDTVGLLQQALYCWHSLDPLLSLMLAATYAARSYSIIYVVLAW